MTEQELLSSPALPLLLSLEAAGCEIRLLPNTRLRIGPNNRLAPEQIAAIRREAEALKALVWLRDASVQERRAEFARQFAAAPAGTVPAFVFQPGLPYVKGTCFSCGDALPQVRYGRCWRCALAWRVAVGLPIPTDLAVGYDDAKRVA